MESCNSLSGQMFNTSLFISYVSRSISQSINHRMIIILRVTSLHDQALKQNKKQTIRSHSSWNSACSLPFQQQRQWRVLMMNASVTTQPTCSPRIHHTAHQGLINLSSSPHPSPLTPPAFFLHKSTVLSMIHQRDQLTFNLQARIR